MWLRRLRCTLSGTGVPEPPGLRPLLVEARAELDAEKRAEMYHEMQVILRDEGGSVIPLFANNVFAMSRKVGHPASMAGNWELDGGRSIERWWFV